MQNMQSEASSAGRRAGFAQGASYRKGSGNYFNHPASLFGLFVSFSFFLFGEERSFHAKHALERQKKERESKLKMCIKCLLSSPDRAQQNIRFGSVFSVQRWSRVGLGSDLGLMSNE